MKLFPMQAMLFARCSSDDAIGIGFGRKLSELTEWSTLRRALDINETAGEGPVYNFSEQDSAALDTCAFCKAGRADTA